MAITVTSKYKPFTYEELVKPLEGYWEKYDKAEEDLTKLKTDTAVLQSVIDSMPEGEEKTKYTNYLSSLNSQAEALASQGLTRDNRNALRNLQTQYAELIPRLSLAEEARRKDLASYKQRANSGEYFMDSSDSPLTKTVVDYLDGAIPTYNNGINKKILGEDAENVAKAYSSRIFTNSTPEEVEEIGKRFIRITQEQGVNADISDVKGSEQFMPILSALYEEYGVNNMPLADQSKAKDFINRKFWEGLVYKKAEDFQQLRNDKNALLVPVGTLSNGNVVVRSGNKHFEMDKDGNIVGDFRSNYDDIDDDGLNPGGSPAQQKAYRERLNYLRAVEHANDVWRGVNVGVAKGNNSDSDVPNDLPALVTKYINTITTDSEKPRNSTRLMRNVKIDGNANFNAEIYEQQWYNEARDNTDNKELFDSYRTPGTSIFLGTGSDVGGKRSEIFGDNHISMVNIQIFLNVLADQMQGMTTDNRNKITEDLRKAYGFKNKRINEFIKKYSSGNSSPTEQTSQEKSGGLPPLPNYQSSGGEQTATPTVEEFDLPKMFQE